MAYISRDPFAREELHRETVDVTRTGESCSWCGQRRCPGARRRTLAAQTGLRYFLYRYRVETDGGRTVPDQRLFCSKGCRESYR
jgi:hypothetical protein